MDVKTVCIYIYIQYIDIVFYSHWGETKPTKIIGEAMPCGLHILGNLRKYRTPQDVGPPRLR